MGSLCSSSRSQSPDSRTERQTPAADVQRPPDPRAAAAAAAEQRLKAAQERGANLSNPNRGKLASQLTKQNKLTPEPKQEERLVWD
ncbi:hypothetical protein APHAL10511_006366 [Amanita phalloides]|nr:hypothetical protein APHAL10511_006366 [Amanita phalloides]